ncbi:phosphoribosylanthranilate isomerase [Thiohalocapsa sp. ML1]|jgi:phosphoribosylanthranilate isomerase|uniref:phosphoribosylanthranilate isomerase n=1 Tax=Thiohalocapsa sp. ML1 TaxID=1431688 RepID=UPI0007320CB5|nr:phosphoribosylanthranilate isomerase [Thiohalocapsa sp. ML1]
MRTRVKICGLTREQDVAAAVAAGADALGFVFHAPSPRAVDIEQAAVLAAQVPAFVSVIGLFVDAPRALIEDAVRRVPLDAIQFHGHESPADCAGYGRPWIKAIAMRAGIDITTTAAAYHGAASLLLDTYDPALAGGTGRRFDWDLVPAALAPHIVLAGGLDAGNVADAIVRARPYAVDVSGGVEQAKGIKDHRKINDFMQGVRDGDCRR